MDDFELIGITTDVPPTAFRWDLLNDDDHLQYSRDLARFVDWLITRYDLHRQIMPCWWQHGAQIEELSALFIAWRGVMETPDRPNSWVTWHEELARVLGRFKDLWTSGCLVDQHSAPAAAVHRPPDEAWPGVL